MPNQAFLSLWRHLAFSCLISIAFLFCFLLLANQGLWDPGLLPVVFLAGMIGGVVNNYRRLYVMPIAATNNLDSGATKLMIAQLYISPIVGGIFGLVLYILFMTHILQGPFFPSFSPQDGKEYVRFREFLSDVDPSQNIDAAKALFWSFVAGFSERFVPNLLDKISNDAKENERELA